VAYGNGDGTFKPKRNILAAEYGLATGDFNEDGFTDVVSTEDFPDPAGTRSVRLWLNDVGAALACRRLAHLPNQRAVASQRRAYA
jgi:hypothetical protein